jgi:hypothetical protein
MPALGLDPRVDAGFPERDMRQRKNLVMSGTRAKTAHPESIEVPIIALDSGLSAGAPPRKTTIQNAINHDEPVQWLLRLTECRPGTPMLRTRMT